MDSRPSRRTVLSAGLAATAVAQSSVAAAVPISSLLSVDYSKLAARADLHYEKPVSRSEEGLPIGNGRMGTLVWTSTTAVKFQINRPTYSQAVANRAVSPNATRTTPVPAATLMWTSPA